VRRAEPPIVAGALVILFLASTMWWVGADSRVPDFDSGKHLNIAFGFREAFGDGRPFAWLLDFTRYPPLVHLTGVLGTIGDLNVDGPIIAHNLVFVPLLALGCYGAASIAHDRTAGVLAVMFALGTPMLINQFHSFLLDAPAAAMAAVAAWALLASDRFERVGFSALAGVAVGLGTMAKQTFLPFVAGLILVVLIRGGWRSPRGVGAFAGAALLVAGPWVVLYLPELVDQSGVSSGASGGTPDSATLLPPLAQVGLLDRFGLDNLAFYGWNFVNFQFLVPLTVFFVVGTVWALRQFFKSPADDDFTPELVIGGLGALVGTAVAIKFNDPRYTLGCLVYVAVLGTGWITQVGRRLRLGATVALVAVVALNTATVTFGVGDTVRVLFSGAPPGGPQRQVTFYSPIASLGGPERGPAMVELFEAARADGLRYLEVDSASANRLFFNSDGVYSLAAVAGLDRQAAYDIHALGPDVALVLLRAPAEDEPATCAELDDGTRIDLVRGGDVFAKIDARDFYCPPGWRAEQAASLRGPA